MLRHIGKCNTNKVTILFREVPNEPSNCLVVFSDILPSQLHDDLMRVLESNDGQSADNFSDACHRSMTTDGRNLFYALHADGFIRKVATASVTVTPNANSAMRLDELNKMLQTIKEDGPQAKRMAELDKNRGVASQERVKEISEQRRQARGQAQARAPMPIVEEVLSAPNDGVLTDEAIANDLRNQAVRAKKQAEMFLAEAERLENDANELAPLKTPIVQEVKKRGRTKVQQES